MYTTQPSSQVSHHLTQHQQHRVLSCPFGIPQEAVLRLCGGAAARGLKLPAGH